MMQFNVVTPVIAARPLPEYSNQSAKRCHSQHKNRCTEAFGEGKLCGSLKKRKTDHYSRKYEKQCAGKADQSSKDKPNVCCSGFED